MGHVIVARSESRYFFSLPFDEIALGSLNDWKRNSMVNLRHPTRSLNRLPRPPSSQVSAGIRGYRRPFLEFLCPLDSRRRNAQQPNPTTLVTGTRASCD